jgi:DNA (cytosine-5)-methyltransferase 1
MSPFYSLPEIIVDSFAGGGGASLGIELGARSRSPHIAINHDEEAIALHTANHPESHHEAMKTCGSDRPENGMPWPKGRTSCGCRRTASTSRKRRAASRSRRRSARLAWTAVRWAKAVRPRVIVLENVEEFETWGPVLADSEQTLPEAEGADVPRVRSFARAVRLSR